MIEASTLSAVIMDLVRERGAEKSICPSEAAKAAALDAPWQNLMSSVRREAIALAKAGKIEITRKGKPVDPDSFRGVYRLRIKADAAEQ